MSVRGGCVVFYDLAVWDHMAYWEMIYICTLMHPVALTHVALAGLRIRANEDVEHQYFTLN